MNIMQHINRTWYVTFNGKLDARRASKSIQSDVKRINDNSAYNDFNKINFTPRFFFTSPDFTSTFQHTLFSRFPRKFTLNPR